VKKQEGITFLLIDMKTPGVTVRPLITIDGGHEVNEVFLENVKVPSRTASARRTRAGPSPSTCSATSAAASPASPAPSAAWSACADRAGPAADDGRSLIADASFKRKVAELGDRPLALEYTELRTLAAESGGKGPGPEASLLKIKGTEIGQRLTELTLEAAGVYGAPYFRGFPTEGGNQLPIGPDFSHRAAPPTSTCAKPRSSAAPTRFSATSSPRRCWGYDGHRPGVRRPVHHR
jgi:alkylation response protein AidB-like acyl-CoA dehydrogenase